MKSNGLKLKREEIKTRHHKKILQEESGNRVTAQRGTGVIPRDCQKQITGKPSRKSSVAPISIIYGTSWLEKNI